MAGVWVRLWCQSNCSSGTASVEDTYAFYRERPTDSQLKDDAMEFGERQGLGDTERGFKYGSEVFPVLPSDIQERLIREHEEDLKQLERRKNWICHMLERLKGDEFRPRSRFERDGIGDDES